MDLPSSPGVYWFLDEKGKVLYVGKAKNLKNRIKSYTLINKKHSKTQRLVDTAKKIKFQTTDSELSAILTEAELIKTYQPPYNVLLKDDKSPLYIIFTNTNPPLIKTARKKQLSTIYSNIPKKNIFGPYSSGYQAKKLLKISRKIFKFCQKPNGHRPCFYFHLGLCSGVCAGLIPFSEYKRTLSDMKIFLKGKKTKLISQLQIKLQHLSDNQQYEQAASIRDQIIALKTLPQNSQSIDNLPILSEDLTFDSLTKLSAILHQWGHVSSGYRLSRIEAYDVSNTSGDLSTASMVVFHNGKKAPDQYRKFRIKYTKGPNDPAMIKEALTRRLSHQEWAIPNLIIIDGGKTQLKSALEITQTIPTISLVKNPDRLLIPSTQGIQTYKLKNGSPAANLVQHIRDESHRFAKSYHSKLRSKKIIP